MLEEKILEVLQRRGEVHTEELADALGIVRHTAAKYLEILRAKGLVRCRRVGNAKLWQPIVAGLAIRPLRREDLPVLLKIQQPFEKTLEAFAQTMTHQLEENDAILSLGAELEGELVGFIVGEIREFERVRTLVDWYNGELISYFRSLGFELMPMLPLEMKLRENGDRSANGSSAVETKLGQRRDYKLKGGSYGDQSD